MPIPQEINALIERLKNELNSIEQKVVEGLKRIRSMLIFFPENTILTQIFATLSNYTLFVEVSRRRIDYISMTLASDVVTEAQVQNAGEDLAELLGRVLDAKVVVNDIKTRLEN